MSTDRYSVLGYLVLIITKFSTFMYLVSKIYFIRKTDIKGALAATLSTTGRIPHQVALTEFNLDQSFRQPVFTPYDLFCVFGYVLGLWSVT